MEQRKSRRVVFERGYDAQHDGYRRHLAPGLQDRGYLGYRGETQRRELDRRFAAEGIFFVVLSSTGLAFRRCELSWVNGDKFGVFFKKAAEKKSRISA